MIDFRTHENTQFIEDVIKQMNEIDDKAEWEIAVITANTIQFQRERKYAIHTRYSLYEIELCNISSCEFFIARNRFGQEITYALEDTDTLKSTMLSLAKYCSNLGTVMAQGW